MRLLAQPSFGLRFLGAMWQVVNSFIILLLNQDPAARWLLCVCLGRPSKFVVSGDLLGGASRFASGSSLGASGVYRSGSKSNGKDGKFAFSLGRVREPAIQKRSTTVVQRDVFLTEPGFGPAILHLLLKWMPG